MKGNVKGKKIRILDRLVSEGFFADEKAATAWIIERKVYAGNELVLSAGALVPAGADIRVKDYERLTSVNKGVTKLGGALDYFAIDVTGKTALDCGAATGGFTDCLLQRGASMVYAVDVGFGQLAGRLRQDNRVVNLERTNLSGAKLLSLDPVPGFITLDLSYLSLKRAIPIAANIARHGGNAVALVKPLFEVESPEMRRSGIITDDTVYFDILMDLSAFTDDIGHTLLDITNSTVLGNKGTVEFFMHIAFGNQGVLGGRAMTADIEGRVKDAVARAIDIRYARAADKM